ncbi:Similar to Putative transporter C543.05c; acc. no. Q9HGM6 [Pyronema omphalodes CBS 100304]|uniref:Similar to Putative transporter C543.05c acc. no. Q9HGM6 n=1 Tax=Pyronema omphalodes (strain CBS 100304) TaxID=1076935 RepID=U4LKI4_PYROM|nr:Similar to Putative transporter C543.05c; acc. no. Q9HGM6 [Pyronema omphalodes CBS 100304]
MSAYQHQERELPNTSGVTLIPNRDQMTTSPAASSPSTSTVNLPPSKPGLFSKNGLLRPFKLLASDFRGLRKRWKTDWGFNQLVLASAVYLFFTNLLPGITFASDLHVLTHQNYGAIEVVFSTGLCGVIFALFSSQPLTILGVTGPFCILSERLYVLCSTNFHIPYLPFMAWSCLHACWMHLLLAAFNAHSYTMHHVTVFSTEIFSLLNSIIYFHKALQELQRAHANTSLASFLYSVIGCIGTFLLAVFLSTANSWRPLFSKYLRMGLTEYAAAISIIFFIGIPHIGELKTLDQQRLPVSVDFRPTNPDRHIFFVRFWESFNNCATLPKYNLKKPTGYAWDVALLGITTGLCGILGIPPANGLLPQAPLHSESLLHNVKQIDPVTGEKQQVVDHEGKPVQTVHEQRWSHLLHAIGIWIFVSPPLMKVLGLTPTSVLAGLFLFMGEQSLCTNPILYRFFHMLTPTSELPPLKYPSATYAGEHMYTLLQIFLTVGIFAITFTPGAPVFPVIIVMLVPVRLKIMSKWWHPDTLKGVDSWACRPGLGNDFRSSRERLEDGDAVDAVVVQGESDEMMTEEDKMA